MGEIISLERARECGDVNYVNVFPINSIIKFRSGIEELTGSVIASYDSSDHAQNIYTVLVGDAHHEVPESSVIETEYVRLL